MAVAQLDFKVLFVPIKPTIKNSASFSCPFDEQDLEVIYIYYLSLVYALITFLQNLLKSVGLNLPGLGSLLSALF